MEVAAVGRTRARLARAACLALLLGACSTPQPVAVRELGDYPLRQRQAAIRIGVDPIFQREQIRAAFPDLPGMAEHGILPIRVQVENGGPQDIQLAPADCILTLLRGSRNAALSSEDVAALLKADAGLWRFVPLPIVSQSAMAVQNNKVAKELSVRSLSDKPIAPGAASSGFLFFYFPAAENTLTGAELDLKVSSTEGDVRFTFPLSGRRDILAPGAPPEKSATPPATPGQPQGAAGQGVIIRSPAR